MQKTGIANLPLHYGKCPAWLFKRMRRLAGAVTNALIYEHGQEEFLKRIADPFWFQAVGCVIGFDWHSSGLSTTVCGAFKESVNKLNLGIRITGGKGKASRKTISEIENSGLSTKKIEKLKYASKMSAKVDSSLIQDGYNLYHHCFIFNEKGKWVVVQQGMNEINNYARRYHWLSDNVKFFVEEPHNAICCDKKEKNVLDMTSNQNKEARRISADLVKDGCLLRQSEQKTLNEFFNNKIKKLSMQRNHYRLNLTKNSIAMLKKAYEIQPGNYEELVALRGMGAKTIRALALISELVYGSELNWKDPAKFSFAHGGKDGVPYPIDKKHYDLSAEIMKNAIKEAKIGEKEKLNAIKRLKDFV